MLTLTEGRRIVEDENISCPVVSNGEVRRLVVAIVG